MSIKSWPPARSLVKSRSAKSRRSSTQKLGGSEAFHDAAASRVRRSSASRGTRCSRIFASLPTRGSFEQPLSPDTAKANIEALLALPHVRVLSEDDGFWRHFTDVTRSIPVRGNLVPDAHLVALLRQHGVRVLYTSDTDFKKFAAVEARDPFGRDDGA